MDVVAAGSHRRTAALFRARTAGGLCVVCVGIPGYCRGHHQPLYTAASLGLDCRPSGGKSASGYGGGPARDLQRRGTSAPAIQAPEFGTARELKQVSGRGQSTRRRVAPASFRSDLILQSGKTKRPAVLRESGWPFLFERSHLLAAPASRSNSSLQFSTTLRSLSAESLPRSTTTRRLPSAVRA